MSARLAAAGVAANAGSEKNIVLAANHFPVIHFEDDIGRGCDHPFIGHRLVAIDRVRGVGCASEPDDRVRCGSATPDDRPAILQGQDEQHARRLGRLRTHMLDQCKTIPRFVGESCGFLLGSQQFADCLDLDDDSIR